VKIRDLMSSPVIIVEADAPLRTAVRMMNDSGVRQLPVVRRNRLVGILTDRDVRLHAIHLEDRNEEGGQRNRELETPVEGVMTRDVVVVTGDQELPHALDLFLSEKFGGLPVVDDFGNLIGMLTYIDMLRVLKDRL
jgi:acetoin utilization protein AcuB